MTSFVNINLLRLQDSKQRVQGVLFLVGVVEEDRAAARLTEVRREQPDAAGLVIAIDREHARGIASLLRARFGLEDTAGPLFAVVSRLTSQKGIDLIDIYWTIGAYDLVCIAEAPDDTTLSAALLVLGAQGNLRTTTLRGFSTDEFRAVIEKAG